MASWYQPPPFTPVKYIPPSQKDTIRAKLITCVHAVAHTIETGPYSGGLTNHWCLYLQTSESESVCVNAQPNPQQHGTKIVNGAKADVLISIVSYVSPPDATRCVGLKVTERELTVARIVDELVQHGRDKYEFTPDGVGCRFWLTETLDLFAGMGLIDPGEIVVAKNDIGRLWPSGEVLELQKGEYYT